MRYLCAVALAVSVVISACATTAFQPDPKGQELRRVTQRMLAAPMIKAQPGFTTKLLVPPGGQFYDASYVTPISHDEIWIGDDGGSTGRGQVVAVDRRGNTRLLVAASAVGAIVGFDVAPSGFGKYGGQVFTLSTGAKETDGMYVDSVVERADPAASFALTIHCTLPPLANGKRPTVPFTAVFGPPGSGFANRLFVLTAGNLTIYEVHPDGQCAPFVTFDAPDRTPSFITFSPDHRYMLVQVTPGDLYSNRDAVVLKTGSHAGSLALSTRPSLFLSVSSDGKILDTPYLEGAFTNVEFAPEGFCNYGGQMFFMRRAGKNGFMPPLGEQAPANASIYRRTREGHEELVASGFVYPRLKFIDSKTLWLADHNADMFTGRREWPDGFIAQITCQ